MQRESDLRRKRMFCEPLLYVSVEDSVALISFSSGEGRASRRPCCTDEENEAQRKRIQGGTRQGGTPQPGWYCRSLGPAGQAAQMTWC